MLVKYGITLTQTIAGSYWYNCLNAKMFLLYGSTLGLFLTICYTGRHYYWHVIKTAIGLKRGEGAAPAMQTWGCRIFLLCMVYFIGNLVYAGMDWQLAIMYAGVIVIFYVVMTRIICESGLFHLQLNVFPCCIIWGILGSINLGPTTLLLMQLISVILICDPRESLMPFMMNSLKVLERRKQPLGKTSAWCGIAMVIGSLLATMMRKPKDRVRVIYLSMCFSLGTENFLLAFSRSPILWCVGQFLGWILVPVMSANQNVIMRNTIPVRLQGRVYACRNTLQFFTIPIGLLFGGIMVDDVCEPIMSHSGNVLQFLFGTGKGSGAALMLFILGVIGTVMCLIFGHKLNKYHYTE